MIALCKKIGISEPVFELWDGQFVLTIKRAREISVSVEAPVNDQEAEGFWGAYENIKMFKEYRTLPISEQSLEQKALNNLSTFIERKSKAKRLI